MIITSEKSLSDFRFWSGASYTASKLSLEDFDTIENVLMDMYPDGMTECEVNDFFWFEEDFIAECLGFNGWDEFEESLEEENE